MSLKKILIAGAALMLLAGCTSSKKPSETTPPAYSETAVLKIPAATGKSYTYTFSSKGGIQMQQFSDEEVMLTTPDEAVTISLYNAEDVEKVTAENTESVKKVGDYEVFEKADFDSEKQIARYNAVILTSEGEDVQRSGKYPCVTSMLSMDNAEAAIEDLMIEITEETK